MSAYYNSVPANTSNVYYTPEQNTSDIYYTPEHPTSDATPKNITVPATTEPLTLKAPIKGGRSAVSELHEMAVQSGQHLEWIQESECGPAHCKLFSMKVVMGSYQATGSGRSKKIAKQVAADTLLKQLQGNTQNSETYGPQLPQPSNEKPTTTATTTISDTTCILQDNPVSKLQEIALKHNLGFPQYQVVCEDGPLALQKFDIKVKVKEMETTGLGRSKKTAKRNAAQAMLDQLSKTNATIGPPQKRMMFVPASSTANDSTS